MAWLRRGGPERRPSPDHAGGGSDQAQELAIEEEGSDQDQEGNVGCVTPFPTVAPTPKPKKSVKARKKLLQVLDKIVDASVVTEQTVATQVQFVEALSDSTDLDPEFRENAVGLLSGLVGKIAEGSGSPSSSPGSGGGASAGDAAGSETESAKVSAKKQAAVKSAVGAVSNVASSVVGSSTASENQTAYEEETERLGSKFEGIIRQLGRAQAGDMLEGEKPRRVKQGRKGKQGRPAGHEGTGRTHMLAR